MKSSGSTADKRRKKVFVSYLLLALIALALGISLALVREMVRPAQPAVTETLPIGPATEPVPPPESAVPEPPAAAVPEETAAAAESATLPERRVAIVIDDVGNSLDELEPFLKLPMPITFAVMPQRTYSAEAARRIRDAGKNYILHQPMEPVGDANPGVGALYVGMSREEIFALLDENLASIGGAEGLNNHMGSKVTADPVTMTLIGEYLKERGMYFLDSMTTGESVAESIAVQLDIPYGKRNSMFLDNTRERDYIERALRSGFRLAETSGRAVMIGHVWEESLADLLMELYPEFDREGYTFDDVGNMIFLGRVDGE